MKKTSTKFIKSTGNVFSDLELTNPEESLVKAELAYQINRLVEKKKLNQKAAAKFLGIDQPKISALQRGRLTGFSVERLFKFLVILNQDIEIIIKPHTGHKNYSISNHVHVRYASM
jgi:predicted XRE-type DNA-binding protein